MSKKQNRIHKKSKAIMKQYQAEAVEGSIIKELNEASNRQLIDILHNDEQVSPWVAIFEKAKQNDLKQWEGNRSQSEPTFHTEKTNQTSIPSRDTFRENKSRGTGVVSLSKHEESTVKFPKMDKREKSICSMKTKSLELKKFAAFFSSKEKPFLKPPKKFLSEKRIYKVQFKTTVLPKVKTEKQLQIQNCLTNAYSPKRIHEKGETILDLSKIQQHQITKLLMKKCIFRR